MCSNLKLSKTQNIVPKGTAVYKIYTSGGKIPQIGTWGLSGGIYYNSKMEKRTSTWKNFGRGIIEVYGFLERGVEVYIPKERMTLALIYNEKKEFSILTEDSSGPLATIHQRMPVILDDNGYAIDAWLIEGKIIHRSAYDLTVENTRA